jgi:hypothetical protein
MGQNRTVVEVRNLVKEYPGVKAVWELQHPLGRYLSISDRSS